MTISSRTVTGGASLLALMAILGVGGCSDGLSLNGKIFDLIGISEAAQAKSKAEPNVAARTGLVLPPDSQRLPAPGSGDEPQAAALASIVDPEIKRANDAAERERLHRAYCSGEMNWKERVTNPNAAPTSPYGPCGALTDYIKSK